jgi:hypothetical protein
MAIDVAARVGTETRAAFRLELRIGAAGAALDFKAAAVHVVSIPLKGKSFSSSSALWAGCGGMSCPT